MDPATIISGVLSSAVFEFLKYSGQELTSTLKAKLKANLSQWVLEDATIQSIEELIPGIPQEYKTSEAVLAAYMESNKFWQQVLSEIKPQHTENHQTNNNQGNSGHQYTTQSGPITVNYIYPSQESNEEKTPAKKS